MSFFEFTTKILHASITTSVLPSFHLLLLVDVITLTIWCSIQTVKFLILQFSLVFDVSFVLGQRPFFFQTPANCSTYMSDRVVLNKPTNSQSEPIWDRPIWSSLHFIVNIVRTCYCLLQLLGLGCIFEQLTVPVWQQCFGTAGYLTLTNTRSLLFVTAFIMVLD